MNSKIYIKEIWQEAFANRGFKVTLFLSLVLSLATIFLTTRWLIYNETRSGLPLDDWILALYAPLDLNIPILFLTQTSIILGFTTSALLPYHLIKTFISLIFIAIFRIAVMYLIPLEPPIDIIPLTDPILEDIFYSGEVLVKDLFFSGHTSNLLLFSLTTPFKKVRTYLFLSTALVAIMLMLQHVHYTIDIIAAIFFTLLAIRIVDTILNFIFKRPIDLSRSKRFKTLFLSPN